MVEAIIGHLVGDYLLQNDWMAKGKKTSSWICAVHCHIWVICVISFAGWWNLPPWKFDIVMITLFISHFVQDRTKIVNWYMTKMGMSEFAKPPMAPWSVIVVDNVLHLVVIFAIAKCI